MAKKKRKPKKWPGLRHANQIRQTNNVWQIDFRPMPNWVRIAGKKVRPWIVLITDPGSDLVLGHDLADKRPTAASLWQTVAEAIQSPAAGRPHYPSRIEVRPNPEWDALAERFDDLQIQLVETEALPHWDFVFDDMSEKICGKPQPGLLDAPGVTPEMAGSCFAAAAGYYRQAPWRIIGDDAAIQIECDEFQSGPWYAVVMGQAGVTYGLAVYHDRATLERLWAKNTTPEADARQTVATSLTFGDETEIPIKDADDAKANGWEIASANAYPFIFYKEPGLAIRPPLVWQLRLMEGCLRAIPEFVKEAPPADTPPKTMTVEAAGSALRMTLTWLPAPESSRG